MPHTEVDLSDWSPEIRDGWVFWDKHRELIGKETSFIVNEKLYAHFKSQKIRGFDFIKWKMVLKQPESM